MSQSSQQPTYTRFPKDQLIQIFKSSASINKSIEHLLETIPEIFSTAVLEPTTLLPATEMNIEDALLPVAEPTPRPMRLVTQKRIVIPKSPFQSSGYAEDSESRVWYYLDEGNNIQGPFTSLEMDYWLESGFLFNELLIRIKENNDFVKLIHLFGKTEIIQVYRPAPYGMAGQCLTPIDSCQKSAELKNHDKKLSKKNTIYDFGFEAETTQSASTPTKLVNAPPAENEKENPLKAERKETADTNNYQHSPKLQEQKEGNSTGSDSLTLESPIAPQKVTTLNLVTKERNEEAMMVASRNSSNETDKSSNNQINEMPNIAQSGRSSQESKNSKHEDGDKKINEKKNNSKRGSQHKQQHERVDYHEKDAKKENNGKNYKEKGQFQFVPKNKESAQTNDNSKKKDKQINQDNAAKEKGLDTPKQLNKKSKSEKFNKNKKNAKEASSPNFKVTEKVVFVAKKKAATPTKLYKDPLTDQTEQLVAQARPSDDSSQLERRVSESFEMLKANSEFFPNADQQCNQSQTETKCLKSNLNLRAAAFNPSAFNSSAKGKNGVNRLKERSKVMLKTKFDYEEAQERLVSSSLNLLDLEDLTPSKKTPVKSSFKSISAGPSPILLSLDKGSINNLYDFSANFSPPTFGKIGSSCAESFCE